MFIWTKQIKLLLLNLAIWLILTTSILASHVHEDSKSFHDGLGQNCCLCLLQAVLKSSEKTDVTFTVSFHQTVQAFLTKTANNFPQITYPRYLSRAPPVDFFSI